MKHKAFIALGSNLSNPHEQVRQAIDLIGDIPDTVLKKTSSLYETAPVGYVDQPDFVNAVVMVETSLTAMQLFKALQAIELKQGRVRTIKNGPRVIDLDLLLFDEQKIETDELIVPHPRMFEREFVMVPLREIEPQRISPPLKGAER